MIWNKDVSSRCDQDLVKQHDGTVPTIWYFYRNRNNLIK